MIQQKTNKQKLHLVLHVHFTFKCLAFTNQVATFNDIAPKNCRQYSDNPDFILYCQIFQPAPNLKSDRQEHSGLLSNC